MGNHNNGTAKRRWSLTMNYLKLDGDNLRTSRWILVVSCFFLLTGCAAGGNFSSRNDKIVWTSNANLLTVAVSLGIETYNIFIMDADGENKTQLTNDAWPIINQHPVFTPNARQIIWLHDKSLWIMNLDGSDKTELSHPPAGEADGHPWAGTDGFVYFIRVVESDQAPFNPHRIWRMDLDGSNPVEIIGGSDKDRFHPNLHRDKNQLVYTAGPSGSGMGTEIRVFDLTTHDDKVVIGPGAFSAAILHPRGNKLVLAQNPDGNLNYEIAEYEFPSGNFIVMVTNDGQNDTIPYYDYPSGSRILWIRQPDRAIQPRRSRHLWLKASDPRPLTSGFSENTEIVGENIPDPAAGSSACIPVKVGCAPTPPDCGKVLLPVVISDDAESLGEITAQEHIGTGDVQVVASNAYLAFMLKDLPRYISGDVPDATEELQERAQKLSDFINQAKKETKERVADFYVNSYFAAVDRGLVE
jgi:Tol biopolymer transport system component